MTNLTQLLPSQLTAASLEKAFADYRADAGVRNAIAMPLDDISDVHRARAKIAWAEYLISYDGAEYFADPELLTWHRIAMHEYRRLAASGSAMWLRGPAGTGKTHELVELCKKWDGQLWYCAPSNVACEVVRLQMHARNIPCAPSVQTPHVRFNLAGEHGFSGLPKWWPKAPNQGRSTKNRLYILDEVFFWDSRTIALSLCCIPSGSVVVYAGDPLQNRPVDGAEIAYWLHQNTTHSVAAAPTPAHQLTLAAAGRDSALEPSRLAHIRNLPPGKILSIELTKIWRTGNPLIGRAREYIFEQHQLPPAGPGLAITRAGSLQKAVDLAVTRVSEGFRVVVPTNKLMIRLTGEINRAQNNPRENLTLDFEEGEKPSDELADGLYFKRGQPCMVLVNDHAAGIHNGLICIYIRWHRPGKNGRAWHEIEIPAKPGEGFVKRRYKLFYQPGKVSKLMSQSLRELRGEVGDDAFTGLLLGDEQRDACAGLLCSPFVLTNHRAQGSTHDKTVMIIPPWLDKTQCAEWLYVAISRARTAVDIIFADDPDHTPEQRDTLFQARVHRLTTSKPHAPNLFAVIHPHADIKTSAEAAAQAA
jgi:hypothetical protein